MRRRLGLVEHANVEQYQRSPNLMLNKDTGGNMHSQNGCDSRDASHSRAASPGRNSRKREPE